MNRIRICQCVDDLDAGGAQQIVRLLVESIDRRRYQPIVYTFRDGPLTVPIEESAVPVRVLPRCLPKFDPILIHRIRRHLLADRIEILHMHLFGATLHGTLAAMALPRLARVVSLHCPREDNPLQRAAYPFLFSMAHSVVGVSHDASRTMARRYQGLRAKLVTIPNGINADLFQVRVDKARLFASLALPPNARVVGTVGRLSREKGHVVLLEAFRQVKDQYPEAFLVLIGDGELRDSLVKRASELRIDASVRFLGARHDVPELLKLMDVFVLSSLWEGLPLVLLEAMAAGVPVVSSGVGGVPEIAEDEREALLIPPSNAPALASALLRIFADSNLAARLRLSATSMVKAQYSLEHMASRHEALYASLHRGVPPLRHQICTSTGP